MKFIFTAILFSIFSGLSAQRTALFNFSAVPCDSIRNMHLREETARVFAWGDSLNPLEERITEYDTLGNLIKQTITGSIYPQGTVNILQFDAKNRMTEDARFYYPDIPIQKNIYQFNDSVFPYLQEMTTIFYINGKADNTVKNITRYNAKGEVLEYVSYNADNVPMLQEKYIIGENGVRNATIQYTNGGKDSVILYAEEDYGLPFHDPVVRDYTTIKMDTTNIFNTDGTNTMQIYQYEPSGDKTVKKLLTVQLFSQDGMLIEDRKLNARVTKYSYKFYKTD